MKREWCLAGVLVVLGLGLALPVHGDCGSIPFRSPLDMVGDFVFTLGADGKTDVAFDPLEVVVFEPGQRAIILWNGEEEILLLSTEIKTSAPVSLLEVIPLPSEPTAKLGDFDTFMKMQRLLIDKAMWRVASGGGVAGVDASAKAAEITFHEQMGAHDVAVVHVLDQAGFLQWVDEFMASKKAVNPKVDPGFAQIIRNYLDRGTQWFVFDTIQAGADLRSRQPIEYRFKTNRLYYPLEISTRETGKTQIDLLLVTPKPLVEFPTMRFAVKAENDVVVSAAELGKAAPPDWTAFMGNAPSTLKRVYIKGNIRKMNADFIAR